MGKTVEEIARKITSDVFKQEGRLGRTLTHPELEAAIAAAIREDRAEPVSEAEVEAACIAYDDAEEKSASHYIAINAALVAARKARTE